MGDKEMLELAAKAAGLKVRWHESGHYGQTMEIMESEAGGAPWDPLSDDGDALRLAIEVDITIDAPKGGKIVYAGGQGSFSELVGNDRMAATRRAIVRAASEIGKAIP